MCTVSVPTREAEDVSVTPLPFRPSNNDVFKLKYRKVAQIPADCFNFHRTAIFNKISI